ncbi:MAG: C-type lectin domain-containing protein [Polyangiaceae bacterium]|nr:C-type lectin domain-containing protein [Polyangiaceae bacterium]
MGRTAAATLALLAVAAGGCGGAESATGTGTTDAGRDHGAAGNPGSGGVGGVGGASGTAGASGSGGTGGAGASGGAAGIGQGGGAGVVDGGDASSDADSGGATDADVESGSDAADAAGGAGGAAGSDAGDAGACVPEICNGKDDNCNGQIDEGNPGGGVSCDTGLKGICAAGTTSCSQGVLGCVQKYAPTTEVCNGFDDNCDGQVDESDPMLGTLCSTGLYGVCATGAWACVGGKLVCEPAVTPGSQPESCDGKDDDCDGVVDDGNPGGGQPCSTGLQGECGTGATLCSNGAIVCNQTVFATAETCNGKDDDCNGVVDDGLGTISCGVGACAVTIQACVGGATQTCTPGAPTTEICNGKDDDCDGVVDNGNPGGGASCSTGKPGICAAGTMTCTGGALVCVQNKQPVAESCNGLDDNCNGVIDDTNACASGNVCSAGTCITMPPYCTGYRYGGHAYAFCGTDSGGTLNWAAASASCQTYGGHLATVSSYGENAFLEGLSTSAYRNAWIGLYRSASNCAWRWADAEPVTFTDWGSGQPDGACGTDDCAQLWSSVNFHWDDSPWCTSSNRYFCEWDQ